MKTITDVAAAAGVSTATVSRVLNDNSRVAPELAERVQRAVKELGYHPSRVARSLRTRQSRVWFLIVSDIHNPFFTDLVGSIEGRAFANDYALVVCNAEDLARAEAYLYLALAERASGIILVPSHPRKINLDPVIAGGVPVVAVDQRVVHPAVDRVLVDNAAGAEAAVSHLADNGYERIALIGDAPWVTTASERLAGYKRGMSARGRRLDKSHVRKGDFRESGGYEEMRALLELTSPPDAVVVANNMMTVGALKALREAHVGIPGGLAVVGFDETPWASLVDPALTTVAQPTSELGAESARLLLSRIDGFRGEARETVLAPSLRIRGSSRPTKPQPGALRRTESLD